MINIIDKDQCCGCTACSSICGHNAIDMEPDPLGFLYPKVDESKCVDCGLCNYVCQFKPDYHRYGNFDSPIAYVARLQDDSQLKQSQSGGAFFAFAECFILRDGIVYGAELTNDWKVVHRRVVTTEELERLRMTKYVQSDLRCVYGKVKSDLQNGYRVLFSGTSCQVAGLKAYIPSKYHQQLTCIDIICHGVPSPQIWDDYIRYLETKHHSKLVKVCFRDKRFGWHGAKESFLFENGKELFRRTCNHLYFSGYTLRPSCSSCKFTNTKRIGDITLGDAWGLPKEHAYEKDGKGASLILVNSEKGQEFFSDALTRLVVQRVELEKFIQPQLQYPTKRNPFSEKFEKDYICKGFEYVGTHYGDMGYRYQVKKTFQIIKNTLKSIIWK